MLLQNSHQILNIHGAKILMWGVLWDGSLVRIMVREYCLRSKKRMVIVKYVFLKEQYDPIRDIGVFWAAEVIPEKLSGRQPKEKLVKSDLRGKILPTS